MPAVILPPLFLERMSHLLKDDFQDFVKTFHDSRINGLRVNTLKISPESFVERWPYELQQIPWINEGFTYDYRTQPGQHPYHDAGVYYLQEPSAMAVLHYLDPKPGERVLDLAAAPGGKSTAIATRLQNQGLLWANEINSGRARILAQNLERWGAYNTIVSNETPDKLAKHLPSLFDRILLDAPCSGEGMFRKDPGAIKEWSPEHVKACANRQSLILESAAALLKPGGRLVYSTCTFSPEENEETILCFLDHHPEFRPLSLPDPSPGFIHPATLPEAVRLYPHYLQGEGHFIVALEKRDVLSSTKEDKSNNSNSLTASHSEEIYSKKRQKVQGHGSANYKKTSPSRGKNNIQDNKAILKEFFDSELTNPSIDYIQSILSFGTHLYYTPDSSLSLNGLNIVRAGLHLGEVKPGRFQPGQALAHALQPDSVRDYLSLSPSDSQCKSYLHGETLYQEGPDGWVLVCVDEFPLGWAKRVKGVLKNHYPKELRLKQYLMKTP